MGLDMFIRRYVADDNPEYPYRVEEFREHFHITEDEILPFPVKPIKQEYYDVRKLAAENGLDVESARIGSMGMDGITIYDKDNKRASATDEEIEQKYTRTEYPDCVCANSVELAYWRKFNALHNWFVENVQNNVDDCASYRLARSDLESLLDDLNSISKNHSLAEEKLPTQSGFFFGGTDYDEWYYQAVEHTIQKISEILEQYDVDNDYIYYHSSW